MFQVLLSGIGKCTPQHYWNMDGPSMILYYILCPEFALVKFREAYFTKDVKNHSNYKYTDFGLLLWDGKRP